MRTLLPAFVVFFAVVALAAQPKHVPRAYGGVRLDMTTEELFAVMPDLEVGSQIPPIQYVHYKYREPDGDRIWWGSVWKGRLIYFGNQRRLPPGCTHSVVALMNHYFPQTTKVITWDTLDKDRGSARDDKTAISCSVYEKRGSLDFRIGDPQKDREMHEAWREYQETHPDWKNEPWAEGASVGTR